MNNEVKALAVNFLVVFIASFLAISLAFKMHEGPGMRRLPPPPRMERQELGIEQPMPPRDDNFGRPPVERMRPQNRNQRY